MNKKVKDISYMMLEYSIRFFLVFVVNIYIASSLGAEKYGEISLYALIIVLISGIMKLNSDSEIFRGIIKHENQIKIHEIQIFKKIFISIIILPIVLSALYYLKIPYYWIILILVFLFFNIFEYLEILKIAKSEIKELMMKKIKLIIFFSIIKILLIQITSDQKFFIFVSFIEIISLIFILMNEKKIEIIKVFKNIGNKQNKNIKIEGWQMPLIFMFFLNIDQIYVQLFYDLKIYGQYVFVVKFILLFNFIPGMILNNFSDNLYSKLKRKNILVIMILLSILCSLFLKIIIVNFMFLFNEEYHNQLNDIEYYFFTILGVFLFSYTCRLSTLLNQIDIFIKSNYFYIMLTLVLLYIHKYCGFDVKFVPLIIGLNLILMNVTFNVIAKDK